MEFKVGDTVRLKSGGPLMTIDQIDPQSGIWCTWFDDKNKRQTDSFKAAVLDADDGTIHIG